MYAAASVVRAGGNLGEGELLRRRADLIQGLQSRRRGERMDTDRHEKA